MRSHIKTLLHLCREHVIQHTSNNIIGAEIGVWQGELSETLLNELPELKMLYMVDRWKPYEGSNMNQASIEDMQQAKEQALSRTRKHGHRRFVIQTDSARASKGLIMMDFVFIDADHRYEAVKRDLHAWWPAVRSGGLFSGHDYRNRHSKNSKIDVKKAVDEFAAARGLTVNGPDRGKIWWIIKP